MMNKNIITFGFGENFIEKCADLILDRAGGTDLSRIACVFGGKRPALFLRRALAGKIKKPFYPPEIFSIDEFISRAVSPRAPVRRLGELDAAYLVFNLAEKHAPEILKGRETFSEFLPWAREMVSFIEQLDLEDIDDSSLEYIEKSAAIGYEIPENINVLLRHIIKVRRAFHRELGKRGLYSRGLLYRTAAADKKLDGFSRYDTVLFCNFFYLHATEQKMIKTIIDQGRGACLFQGSEKDWSVLKKNFRYFSASCSPDKDSPAGPEPEFLIYRGFDIHSQVGLIHSILENTEDKANTVIVVPRPETVVPLLTDISPLLEEFNVSLGYPLKRTSLYTLFDLLRKAQESRKETEYYTRDYLSLLRHPLVKNLILESDPALTRVLIHKLEELLQGKEESTIGGTLFLSLERIEAEEKIYINTSQTLRRMGFDASPGQSRKILEHMHRVFFRLWEEISTFQEFAVCLEELIAVLIDKSMLTAFPFNLKVVERMNDILEEISTSLFRAEPMDQDQLWDILRQKLEREVVHFIGSPLRGTQILGLFETRSLDFKNVIVMDMNESVLPRLKIYEPLIPREVMLSLGLNRLEKEEEIQRYQFMRLVSSAKRVHLVYEENKEKEKSRFIEELLWKLQKEKKSLEVMPIPKAAFPVRVAAPAKGVDKNEGMIKHLLTQTYSASRLNTYLNCPMQFYFKYVLGLQEKEDLLEDPQATHIGTFIHELLEEMFKPFVGKKPVIDDKFRKKFFRAMDDKFDRDLARRMRSDSFLLKKIIRKRLESFLDNEQKRDVAAVICLEEKRQGCLTLNNREIQFNLTADRIDALEDKSIVIIDYKTGGADISPKRLSSLEAMDMTRASIKENMKSFQLPIYFYFISSQFPGNRVNAELYNIRTLKRTSFIKPEEYGQKDKLMDICIRAMEAVFAELFDQSIPFSPDHDDRFCSYCPFISLCR